MGGYKKLLASQRPIPAVARSNTYWTTKQADVLNVQVFEDGSCTTFKIKRNRNDVQLNSFLTVRYDLDIFDSIKS